MNARTRLIRGWLLQQPRPAIVRVHSGEDLHTIEIGQTKWASIASSVDALDPDLIEALDEKSKLIRAIKSDQLGDDEPDESGETGDTKAERKRQERETAMLTTFAQLLAEAYKHSTTVAFSKMVELFEAVAKRGESLEKSLAATERLLRRAYEEGAADKEGEPSLLETMLNAYAAGQEQKATEAAVSGVKKPTNGKAQI